MQTNANEAISEATENPEEAAARAALGHTLKRVGPFHPTTMQTLDSLANILQSQNKMEEAEHLRRQADRVSCAAAANLTTRHTLLPPAAHANVSDRTPPPQARPERLARPAPAVGQHLIAISMRVVPCGCFCACVSAWDAERSLGQSHHTVCTGLFGSAFGRLHARHVR